MIIAAAVILAVYGFNNFIENTLLIIALLLLFFGIIVHILVNKKIDEVKVDEVVQEEEEANKDQE